MKNLFLTTVAFVFVATTASFASVLVENQTTSTVKPVHIGQHMLADKDGAGHDSSNDSGDDNDSSDDNDGGADNDSNDDKGGSTTSDDKNDNDDDGDDDDGAAKRMKKSKSLTGKKIKSKS